MRPVLPVRLLVLLLRERRGIVDGMPISRALSRGRFEIDAIVGATFSGLLDWREA